VRLRATYEKFPSLEIEASVEAMWIELLKESGWLALQGPIQNLLSNCVSGTSTSAGKHETALPIFSLALEIARTRNDEKPTLLADLLMCLAATSVHTSRAAETLEYAHEHQHLRKQIYVPSKEDMPAQVEYNLAMGYATVAMAFMIDEQFEEAVRQAEHALQLYQSFPLYKDWKTVPFFAIAHAGWSLRRYKEAEEVLCRAVEAERARNAPPSYGYSPPLYCDVCKQALTNDDF
jgi:tetratricopeptide (TPR) repeat protein